jgi:hypothetical protein
MNPLKSSSSQQYNKIDNSHSNVMLPCKRLPTTGDGNCLIHALFGEFSDVKYSFLEPAKQEFFHKNAPAVRFEIAHKLFNQVEGNHAIYEELYSIDELGSASFSPININNLALSLQKNGEYLGLEHAHLIAKAFKLNIRVYYPKSHAYEKIDLFHRDTNTQEVDRIVYFNGIDHWEKCELSNEPGLPSSLGFIIQHSLDESTSASSRRSSFDLRPKPQSNPKYKQIFSHQKILGSRGYSPSERIKANNRAILVLKCENHHRMKNSYLFKFCKPQEYNELFLKTFAEFFQHLRGSEPLATSAGKALSDKFRGYKDVCVTDCSFNHSDYGSAYDYTYSPTSEVIAELKQIIEEEHGLKDFFFETLQRNHFRISEEYKLEDRDTFLREFPVFPRVYPRCADVLKDVFTDLLSVKWLENDIDGLKYYLDQNTPIERPLDLGKLVEAERVWKLVKQAVDAKINNDEKLNKHFYDELKKDIKNLGISSMVSFVPGCGAAFLGGVGRTVINTLGNYVDPEGKQTSVQSTKRRGGRGLGKQRGGDVFELGTSMGIDLVEFYVRDEKTTKNEGSALSIYTSALKGLFTGDKQKLIAQILGTCVAETAERVDEKDAPLDIKIILALLKNPDARGLIVNDIVNEFSKEKPKTESELKPKEQIITEVEPEQIIKEPEQPVKVEMQNEPLYLRLIEEQKQNQVDLNLAQADCETKRLAAEKASKKEQNLHKKNTGFKLIPQPKVYQEWLDSQKTLATKNSEHQTSQGRVNEIQEKIYNNSKAQLVASTPKIPTTQTDKGLTTSITNLNRIDREIPEKILAVEKSIDKYNEHHRKDSYFSEVKRTIKDLNASFKDRDTEQNNIHRLNGVESNIETPLIEIPKKASALAKIVLWCKDNVVLGIHPPTQPFNYDPNKPTPPQSNKQSTYHETRHQINLERSEIDALEEKSKPVSQGSNWNSVSHYHSQRMFNMNMNYQSPSISSQERTLPQRQMQMAGFSPLPMDIETSEVVRNVFFKDPHEKAFKVAASLTKGLLNMFVPDMSDMPGAENPRDHINRIVTPEATGDFIKSLPKGPAFVAKGILSMMLPDMSDVKGAEDPKTHFNRVFQSSVKKYDEIVQIHNPNGLAARSGIFVGEMVALGGVGKVIRVAEGLSVFGMACEGGFIGGVMSEAYETNVVAGVAFGFIGGAGFSKLLLRGGGASKPLIDRTLVRPQGFGRQLRNAEIQQVLRCGFVSNKTVMRLTEREIKAITPMKLPSVQKGNDLKWFAENSPKVDLFRKNAINDNKFYLAVRREFAPQNLNELQIRRTLDYAGFNTYAIPEGLSKNIVVEFADKNGGMLYRKIGSSNPENLVVRVCPGLAKESVVSSYINGQFKSGRLRQQTPYVVQSRDKLKLTVHGDWIDVKLPQNKVKEALTHIPLETYKFKGWN